MVTFIVGQHHGKITQRVMNINASATSFVERLCDLKIFPISVLSFFGSVCAPDDTTLKAENHAHLCRTAGPYTAIPSNLVRLGSVCGIGPDLVGVQSISLASRFRVAACSTTLWQGIEKIRLARGQNCGLLFPLFLSRVWEKELLSPSMAHSTVSAYDTVRQLDHDRKLHNASNDKKQNIATRLLRDSLFSQGFAGPISVRATRILGPISRCRVADILPHITSEHPVQGWLLVYYAFSVMACALPKGSTTTKKSTRAVMDAQIGLDSLSHYSECPLLHK